MNGQLPELVQALLEPSAYPDRPQSVDFVQTHISYVFLAGEFVYKLKKPVDFGFLDFSTPERRRASCEDEVRLNRRLSPDVYISVQQVTRAGGRLQIGGAGPPVDWAVQMRRLPDDRMLERLIAARAVPDGTGRRLGEVVARFHVQARAEASEAERIAAIGGRAAVEGNWRENFDQTRPFRGRTLDPADDDRIRAYVDRFLDREGPLLAERDADGFIRDLHGDLRSAQIWVLNAPPPTPRDRSPEERELLASLNGIRILDCIEFNERLRFCDTASDVGFLAMDLAFRRAAGLRRELLNRYLEVTLDARLPLLLDFYGCYRAYVRGKVDSLALTEREMDAAQRRRLAARARRFFRAAARYAAAEPRPRLTAMMGISGSGKSYLARLVAIETGAVLLSSDVVRKRLAGVAPTSKAPPEAYTHAQTERVYAAMIGEARRELERGHPVIVDATFLLAAQRRPAVELARALRMPFRLIWCRAGPETIAARLGQRHDDPYRVSDAEADVVRDQLAYLEPPRELPRDAVIRVDASRPLEPLLRRLRQRLSSDTP